MINRKYVIVLSILLVGICAHAFGFSHADTVKAGYRAREYLKWHVNSKYPKGYVSPYITVIDVGVAPVAFQNRFGMGTSFELNKDGIFVKLLRYHIWYNELNEDNFSSNDDTLVTGNQTPKSAIDLEDAAGNLSGSVAFLAADCAITKAADTLSTNESVKEAIQFIPKQSREFGYESGRMVLASAAGYATRIAVTEGRDGLNWENATSFGKAAAKQVGADLGDQYIAKPIADYCLGKERTLSKEALQCALTLGTVIALNTVIGK